MNTVFKVGLDPGFGGTKAATIINKGGQLQIVSHTLPSVVGVGSTDTGALSLSEVVRSGRRATPQVVSFAGLEYLVGAGVANHASPLEQTDFTRFNDTPELRAQLYTALANLLALLPVFQGEAKLALAVGLPVEIMKDKGQAAAIERAMAKWLVGRHEFIVDDRPIQLTITGLRAKAQPLCTWLDWGLDLTGQWPSRNGVSPKAPALIIDIGFNTLDLFGIENGDVSMRYTDGDNLGMRRAAEIAIDNIMRRYRVEMALHEADELVQAVVGGKKPRIYVEGKPTDVTTEFRQALNSLTTLVMRFVEKRAGRGRKFKIFMTGGGAIGLGARMIAQYDHAVVVEDPVLANARGLAKLAVRPGFLD